MSARFDALRVVPSKPSMKTCPTRCSRLMPAMIRAARDCGVGNGTLVPTFCGVGAGSCADTNAGACVGTAVGSCVGIDAGAATAAVLVAAGGDIVGPLCAAGVQPARTNTPSTAA